MTTADAMAAGLPAPAGIDGIEQAQKRRPQARGAGEPRPVKADPDAGYFERIEVDRLRDFNHVSGHHFGDAVLRRLVDEGCLVGLVTGNVEAAAHIKLARGGLNRFFSFGGYGSDSNDRVEVTKKALERARFVSGETLDMGACVGVGDTPRDVDAAHGAGIRSVAVATGNYEPATLADAGADFVLGTLGEWPAELEEAAR